MKFLKIVLFLLLTANALFSLVAMEGPGTAEPKVITIHQKYENINETDNVCVYSTQESKGVTFKPVILWPELAGTDPDPIGNLNIPAQVYQCDLDVPLTSIELLQKIISNASLARSTVPSDFDQISLEQLKDVAMMADTLAISRTIGINYKIKEYLIARKILVVIQTLSDTIRKSCSDLDKKEQVPYSLDGVEQQIQKQNVCKDLCAYLSTLNSTVQNGIKNILQSYIGYDQSLWISLASQLIDDSVDKNKVYDERGQEDSLTSTLVTQIFNGIYGIFGSESQSKLESILQQWELLAAKMITARLQRIENPIIVYPKDILNKITSLQMSINKENEFLVYNKNTGYCEKIVLESSVSYDLKEAIIQQQKKYNVWLKNQSDLVDKVLPSELPENLLKAVDKISGISAQSRDPIQYNRESIPSNIQNMNLSLEEKRQIIKFFSDLKIKLTFCLTDDNIINLDSLLTINNADKPWQEINPINNRVVITTISAPDSPQKGMPWKQILAALLVAGGLGTLLYKYLMQNK